MGTLLRNLATVVSLISHLGVGTIWRAMRYRVRHALWQARYRTPEPARPAVYPGTVQGWKAAGSDEEDGKRNGADLRCANGSIRVEFPAEGVARVRLSRDGRFSDLHSYAVLPAFTGDLTSGEQQGPPGATQPRTSREDEDRTDTLRSDGFSRSGRPERLKPSPQGVEGWQFHLEAVGEGLGLEGPGITAEVAAESGRLAFREGSGRPLIEDAEGAGWRGTRVLVSLRLAGGAALYGLGEKAYPLNLRGRRLTMWNTDPSGYGPGADPLYQSIPFVISVIGGSACGVLFDNTYRSELDLDSEEVGVLRYEAAGGEPCYYVLAGPGIADVLKRYAELTGHMPLPPRWALGYHQSRWSYASADEARWVARELRTRRIPCDAIHLDIDYMRGYRLFTWATGRFPDPAGLIGSLREQGLRTVTIVDPGVKADRAYGVCREGLANEMFCRLPGGKTIAGPVWPGECYFPDFADEKVRRWWGDQYRGLVEAGVAGFWNDMNEPALFFAATLPDATQHRTERGPADHRELHNVYGQLMAQASAEGLHRLKPRERSFLLTRAGYAGIQRYAATWTGDNQSTWEHLRLTIPMVLNLGLSGQPMAGPDVGGFAGDCDGELLARWTEAAALLPFFRNHSALGTARQEPWAFGEPYETICRRHIELRYRLMPYIYTAFWQAAEIALPVARPLALAYPGDPAVANLDDEYLCGDALLVAPLMEQGAAEREIYFPAGRWYSFWSDEPVDGPCTQRVGAPLDRLPLYVRAGSVIPMGPVMQYTDEFVPEKLELHVYVGDGDSVLYEDDGHSTAYHEGEWRVTRFKVRSSEDGIVVERSVEGRYEPGYAGYDLRLHGSSLPINIENS